MKTPPPHCRVCQSSSTELILDLGSQPPANGYEDAHSYPLTLWCCQSCGLVQIAETLPREKLFSNYVWVTGTSSSACQFSRTFRDIAVRKAGLQPGCKVVEIASNDGTFLKPFADIGCQCLGIDPAENLAVMARQQGLEIWTDFWEAATAKRLSGSVGRVDFLFARNVIAHASDLQGFAAGLEIALRDGGLGAVEFHWAKHILHGLQYDSIYHEHLCYFSLATVARLLEDHGLTVVSVEESPISGGALIVYFSKSGTPDESVARYRGIEQAAGLANVDTWKAFGQACIRHAEACRKLLVDPALQPMIGYGASARSNTFLNFVGATPEHLSCIIDNNPAKQGRLAPGSGIPIVSESEGLASHPKTILCLAWNFQAELLARCQAAGFRGGWLTAFPDEPHYRNLP